MAEQILFAVKKAVVNGQLRPGDRFPSVRVLSQELKVNPNTAHKVVAALVAVAAVQVRVRKRFPAPSARRRPRLRGRGRRHARFPTTFCHVKHFPHHTPRYSPRGRPARPERLVPPACGPACLPK